MMHDRIELSPEWEIYTAISFKPVNMPPRSCRGRNKNQKKSNNKRKVWNVVLTWKPERRTFKSILTNNFQFCPSKLHLSLVNASDFCCLIMWTGKERHKRQFEMKLILDLITYNESMSLLNFWKISWKTTPMPSCLLKLCVFYGIWW